LYQGNWSEAKEIKIEGTDAITFKQFLEFLYSGSIIIEETNALKLLSVAFTYGMTTLEDACSGFLGKTLEPENTLDVLSASLNLTKKELQLDCLTFIRSHPTEVLASKSFLEQPLLIVKMLILDDEFYTDELDLFESALKWGQNQLKIENSNQELSDVMSELVQIIRFPLIPAVKLINRVKNTGVVPIDVYVEALEFSASPRTATSEGVRFKKRKLPPKYANAEK